MGILFKEAKKMTKTVTIQIADNDYAILKAGGTAYNLCFARKVGDSFNVVWRSFDKTQWLQNNMFSWTPAYQVFGSNEFAAAVNVSESTNMQNVLLGEQVVLDENGHLGSASTAADHKDSVTFVNQFGTIHPGMSALSIGIDGVTSTTPIYVAQSPMVKGTDYLTPKDSVQVWFEQDIETSTMFSDARSMAIEVDMTDTDAAVIKYTNQEWNRISDLHAAAIVGDPKTYLTILVVATVAVNVTLLANKIASYLTQTTQKVSVSVSAKEKEVKISYTESPRLTVNERNFNRVLAETPSFHEMLLSTAISGLAAVGADYTSLNATAN